MRPDRRCVAPERLDTAEAVGGATGLWKAGADALAVSKMLGHSSIVFTQSTYTHVDDEMVERAAQGLAKAFGS